MATETFVLPGYGVVVDAQDGDEALIPGYGVVIHNQAQADLSGTLAASEAADIATLAGAVIVAGDLAASEAADVAALVGTVTIAGILAATEPIDVSTITGSVILGGDLAATDPADTAALTGRLTVAGNPLAPWIYQVDACRQGPIVAEGRRQNLTLDVVFDPVKAETS